MGENGYKWQQGKAGIGVAGGSLVSGSLFTLVSVLISLSYSEPNSNSVLHKQPICVNILFQERCLSYFSDVRTNTVLSKMSS